MLLAREMGVNLTPAVIGKQLPFTAPAKEFGDGLLHTMVPCLPGLMMAPKKGWKNTGMLAGVANCGRIRKWGCRGRFAPGFKHRCSNHAETNHAVWGVPLPHGLGSRRARCSNHAELSAVRKNVGPCGRKRGEKTLAGGP